MSIGIEILDHFDNKQQTRLSSELVLHSSSENNPGIVEVNLPTDVLLLAVLEVFPGQPLAPSQAPATRHDPGNHAEEDVHPSQGRTDPHHHLKRLPRFFPVNHAVDIVVPARGPDFRGLGVCAVSAAAGLVVEEGERGPGHSE